MEGRSESVRVESLESLRSSIAKTRKGLASMQKKGANTTLARRRLEAMSIGLAVLESGTTGSYSPEALSEARDVLAALIPSIEALCERSNRGSPQKTLLERRIMSLEQAVQSIDTLMDGKPDTLPSYHP